MESPSINLFIVLVSALIRNTDKILLLKRSDKNKSFQGFWQLPEGKLEQGEQAETALAREIKEELNCQCKTIKLLLTAVSSIEVDKQEVNILRVLFEVKLKGKIILSEDHSGYKWFTYQQAGKLSNLFPGLKDTLARIGSSA